MGDSKGALKAGFPETGCALVKEDSAYPGTHRLEQGSLLSCMIKSGAVMHFLFKTL
jgi:hypothetical protein